MLIDIDGMHNAIRSPETDDATVAAKRHTNRMMLQALVSNNSRGYLQPACKLLLYDMTRTEENNHLLEDVQQRLNDGVRQSRTPVRKRIVDIMSDDATSRRHIVFGAIAAEQGIVEPVTLVADFAVIDATEQAVTTATVYYGTPPELVAACEAATNQERAKMLGQRAVEPAVDNNQ